MLVLSSPTKKRLEKAINEFYYSKNYFINSDNKAENRISKKQLGEIKEVKNRFQYHL